MWCLHCSCYEVLEVIVACNAFILILMRSKEKWDNILLSHRGLLHILEDVDLVLSLFIVASSGVLLG